MTTKSDRVGQILYGKWYVTQPWTPFLESGNQTLITWNNYLTGSDDPGWKRKVIRHESATNGMSAAEKRVDIHPGSATYAYKRGTDDEWQYSVYGNITRGNATSHFLSHDPDQTALVKQICDVRFINRYNSLKTAFESGAFTGEIRETLSSLRHPLKSLRNSIREYLERSRKLKRSFDGTSTRRRSRVNNVGRSSEGAKRRLLGAIGDSYLEFRFGIRPLISDINNVAKALNRPQRNFQVFSADVEEKFSETGHLGGTTFGGTAWVLTSEDRKWFYQCRAVGEIAAANGATARNLNDFGIYPSNFVPTLYELLPYSWLADYFTNLGDIVAAACVNFGDLTWFSRTQRTFSTNSRLSPFRAENVNFTLLGSNPTRQVWFNKEVVRTASRPTVPDFSFNIPHGLEKFLDTGFVAQNLRLDRQPLGKATRNAYRQF